MMCGPGMLSPLFFIKDPCSYYYAILDPQSVHVGRLKWRHRKQVSCSSLVIRQVGLLNIRYVMK